MAQHTPGPWALGPSAVVLGSDGRRVCSVEVRIDDTDVADGHLIAAAPEMIEALYQYRDDLLYPPTGDSRDRRLERVRKVIAKATGGQA